MITFAHNKYRIIFYVDKHGYCPIQALMDQLMSKHDKESRIILNKFNDYMQALKQYGAINLPSNYVKHLENSIWELRPKRYRILFSEVGTNEYVLLHCFYKTTQKTPRKELEKAYKELCDYKERTEK